MVATIAFMASGSLTAILSETTKSVTKSFTVSILPAASLPLFPPRHPKRVHGMAAAQGSPPTPAPFPRETHATPSRPNDNAPGMLSARSPAVDHPPAARRARAGRP